MSWQEMPSADYLLGIIILWLALLSFYTFRNFVHHSRLAKSGKSGQFLEGIPSTGNQQAGQIEEISKAFKKIESAQNASFQKYALIRFNPFEDTGGDQSFVVALLDGDNNGMVISSLHSRTGTRVYAKQVSGARATTHQFSKEEKEVVEKAARHV